MGIADRILTVVVALLTAGLVLVPTTQVVMRSIFALPFIGAEELTRFLLICLVFCSYPLVVANGENIVMGESKLLSLFGCVDSLILPSHSARSPSRASLPG
ncbi:MAG: TRAP transporter small permease [Pseudorhizobium sp.]